MSETLSQHPTDVAKIWLRVSASLCRRAWALSLLRAVAGFTFAIYGAQLVFGNFGGHPQALFSLLWFAGVLEFFGGLLIGLGLFTRPIAFILSGEMAFAFFIAHFPKGWNPALNGGETSVLFCFIFLYLAAAGPGSISLSRLWTAAG
jgi:putative oxidoreductase